LHGTRVETPEGSHFSRWMPKRFSAP
jgi:hypothetical protein